MPVSSRRPTLVTGLTVGIATGGIALFASAPFALAAEVTNPADHPAPVTVTIDGQTYTDGLDTLPGNDDHACTPIPNVEYDFAGDQILYYDSQGDLLTTARWTEWDRISSYKTWVDQQSKASTPTVAPSTTIASPGSGTSTPNAAGSSGSETAAAAPGASAPGQSGATAPAQTAAPSRSAGATAGSTTKGAAAPTTKSKTPKQDAARARRKAKRDAKAKAAAQAEAQRTGATAAAAPAGDAAATTPGKTSKGGGAAATSPGADPSALAAAAAADGEVLGATTPDGATAPGATTPGAPTTAAGAKPLAKAVTEGAGDGAGDTRVAGLGILGALSLGGFLLLSGNFARRGGLGPKS